MRKITKERFVEVRRLLDNRFNSLRAPIQPEKPEPGFFSSHQIHEHTGLNIRKVQYVIQDLLRRGDLIFKKFRVRCSPVSVRLVYHYKARTPLARKVIREKLSYDIARANLYEKKS